MFAHLEDIDKWYPIRPSEAIQERDGASYYPLLDYSDETKICSSSSDAKVTITLITFFLFFFFRSPNPPFPIPPFSPNSKKSNKKSQHRPQNPSVTPTSPPSTQNFSSKPTASFMWGPSVPFTIISVSFVPFKLSNRERKLLLRGQQAPRDRQEFGSKESYSG